MEAETPPETKLHLAGASKRVAQRLLVIFGNRFELLMVEAQEERERILCAIVLAVSIAALGLLAGIALTGVIVIALWGHYPLIALSILTVLYAATAIFLCIRLVRLQRDWQTFGQTMEQLKKDRECLEKELN